VLIFNNLLIVDYIRKEAKYVSFGNNRNLITSDSNSKGKSTIMKSLYHTLGANSLFDDEFEVHSKMFDIEFNVNDQKYRICRYQDEYTIFKEEKLIKKFSRGNIESLSLFYEEEFGFSVYLKSRTASIVLAPPAMSFLPYYLDQDKSWKKEVEPFENLGQFEKLSRNDLFYYHLNILNKDYISYRQLIQEKQKVLTDKKNEQANSEEIYKTISETIKSDNTFINENEMEIVLNQMKNKINHNLSIIAELKEQFLYLDSSRFDLEIERKDIDRIITQLASGKGIKTSKEIKCPNCESIFEISFEEEIEELYNLSFLRNRAKSIDFEIKEFSDKLAIVKSSLTNQLSEINALEEQVKVKESAYQSYINRKAYDNIISELVEKMTKLNIEIQSLENEIKNVSENIEKHQNLKKEAHELFVTEYTRFLRNLNVTNFKSDNIKPFQKLRIGGSQYVRSTLAYFFAFLEIKTHMNVQSFKFPLVIDSPREGEQDNENSQDILEFILNSDINDYQMLVSSVNADQYIDLDEYPDLNLIVLDNPKYQLLNSPDYTEHQERIYSSIAAFNLRK
jgi:chaperonin cofactor prefoldin